MSGFDQAMHDMRKAAGLSLRDLAKATHIDAAHLSRIERGLRRPPPELAAAIDRALNANGTLRALVPAPDLVKATGRESERLATLIDGVSTADAADSLALGVHSLAVDYLSKPAGEMLKRSADIRKAAVSELRRTSHPRAVADLASHIGHASGILAYAALDLGDPVTANIHASLTRRAADAAGNLELRAWARGTQSLIARFAGDYRRALDYAREGLDHAPTSGTAKIRLLCGVGQCYANLGDRDGAHRALNEALDIREASGGPDAPGLFGFSVAKQQYYAGSSLMWLPGQDDALRARNDAIAAIELWQTYGVAERSLDDEALAHLYAARACITLGDLEQAVELLEPILGLPEDQRISWIRKRLDDVAADLAKPRYAADPLAIEIRGRIREYR